MPGGGPHSKDPQLFAEEALPTLRKAASELAWLRARGYAETSALKLVGDRYQLERRQRTGLLRATSSAGNEVARAEARVAGDAPPPSAVWVDGFNVVITLETALRGGVLVSTLDGTLRDLAGVHGAYRVSDVSARALQLVREALSARGWRDVPVRFLLDAPVSNTGRLAARVRELAEAAGLPWSVEVVADPDPLLGEAPADVVVASGDAPVLDRLARSGARWLDLAGEAIRARCPDAWIVDLDLGQPPRPWPRELLSERLRLREPRLEDAAWIFADYAQDPEVTRFLTWSPHAAISETEDFLNSLLATWESTRNPWVIERREDGRGLGMIGASRAGPMAELGYVLAREHWGQGLMSEAVRAVADALLQPGLLSRLHAVCDIENFGSASVLEKAGFAREGVLRGYCCRPERCGDLNDVFLYGRVRS